MALFVFQAAAARAGVVAVNDTALCGKRFGAEIRSVGVESFGNQIGLGLAEQFFHIGRFGVDSLDADGSRFGNFFYVGIALDLDGGQEGSGLMLDTAPQVFKHGEGFAFVFLFRIFLGIAAQVDALTQIVHGGKVFAPLQVDDLQHDVAFEIRHRFFTDQLDFCRVFFFNMFNQTLFNVLIV